MATVIKDGPDRWVVHLGSAAKSEITIEVHMSRETAEKIASREASRIEMLNPGCDDLPEEDPGTAVLKVLGLYAAGERV